MTYHTCLTCPPHTTLDHEANGKGACLMPKCPCQKMENGAVFVKEPYVRRSHAEATKAGEERGEAE